ncbi:MAG TPA: hypothetical protein VN426_17100 [Syntrophomonadaceae bacterium]|nr:hypothetical protein [Syntrophomonadaceae bacterium]
MKFAFVNSLNRGDAPGLFTFLSDLRLQWVLPSYKFLFMLMV